VGGIHCDEAVAGTVTAMITIGLDPEELHLTRVTGDVDASFARTYREGDLLAFSDGTVLRARWQSTLLRPAAPAPRYRSGPDKPAPGRVTPQVGASRVTGHADERTSGGESGRAPGDGYALEFRSRPQHVDQREDDSKNDDEHDPKDLALTHSRPDVLRGPRCVDDAPNPERSAPKGEHGEQEEQSSGTHQAFRSSMCWVLADPMWPRLRRSLYRLDPRPGEPAAPRNASPHAALRAATLARICRDGCVHCDNNLAREHTSARRPGSPGRARRGPGL
jgi:hypothetical protein